MTPKQALEWLIEELGTDKTNETLLVMAVSPDTLEQNAKAWFKPCDPRRQKFRQAVRILIEELKGLK